MMMNVLSQKAQLELELSQRLMLAMVVQNRRRCLSSRWMDDCASRRAKVSDVRMTTRRMTQVREMDRHEQKSETRVVVEAVLDWVDPSIRGVASSSVQMVSEASTPERWDLVIRRRSMDVG